MKKRILTFLAIIATLTITTNTLSAQVRGDGEASVNDGGGNSDGWGYALRFGADRSSERIGSNRLANEWGGPRHGFTFWTKGEIRMVIDSIGHVGIGTKGGESLKAKLTVNGNTSINGEVRVKSITMTSDPNCWPDYVFAKNYTLMNLNDLENFININHHLPNFQSAKEIETNGGSYDVNEVTTGLLKTIEEQALYIINLNKEFNSRLEERNEKINSRLEEQNKKISELEARLNHAKN